MRLAAAMVTLPGISADFFRDDDTFVDYSIVDDRADDVAKAVHGAFPGLPWNAIDTVANWGNGKGYFFRGGKYVRFEILNRSADPGYPKLIKDGWPGLTWTDLDAVVAWNNGKAYAFKGSQYVRIDMATKHVDSGYPKPVRGNWPGLPWDTIDTVVNWGDGKAYFFHDQQYVRYDMKADRVDAGYPLRIVDQWPGVIRETVRTSFDVAEHGFHFVNHFELSQGLFGGDGVPKVFGLCGGMCAAALARYTDKRAVEKLTHPPQQTCPELELFWELVQRQCATLFPDGIRKLASFLLSVDGVTTRLLPGGTEVTGIVTMVRNDEWPNLRKALDAGHPTILLLVRSTGLKDLTENHQVVAIGYSWNGGARPTIHIYDPNHPGKEQDLEFTLADDKGIHGTESDGHAMRGWFVNPVGST